MAATELSKVSTQGPTEEQLALGLMALAMEGGNAAAASRRLRAGHAMKVTPNSLRAWSRKYPDDYARVRYDLVDRVHAKIATQTEDLALAYAEKEAEALAGLDISRLEQRDISTAIRNLATSRGISIDKANVMRGKPSQIIEQRNPAEIVKALAQLGIRVDMGEVYDLPASSAREIEKGQPEG